MRLSLTGFLPRLLLSLFALSLGSLYAARAIATGGTAGVFTTGALVIGDSRLEVRISDVQPCTTGSVHGKILNITNLHGLSCTAAGGTTVGNYNVSGTEGTYTLTPGDDVVIRLQRFSALGRYGAEIWRYDGTKLASVGHLHGNAAGNRTVTAGNHEIVGNAGGMKLAWVRWYSTTVPENSAMPKDSGVGDRGSWEFENNGTDASGLGRTVTKTGATYVDSAIHSPVVQFEAPGAKAGQALTLDGNESFTYDGTSLSDYTWQQVSGPTTALFSDRRAVSPTLTGLVAGDYQVKMTATDSGGNQSSVTKTIAVASLDSGNFAILPTNWGFAAVPIRFRLADVTGAVDVRVTVKKPDGRLLPSIVCTTAPCNFYVDDRQKDHLMRLEYRKSGGAVLVTGDWQPIKVVQAARGFAPTNLAIGGHYHKLWMMGDTRYSGTVAETVLTRDWLKDKGYDFSGGAYSMLATVPSAFHPKYTDLAGIYLREIYELREIAAANGYEHEHMFLHAGVDYKGTCNGGKLCLWSLANRFDYGEETDVGGVVLQNGASFVGKTAEAYSAAAADVAITDRVLIAAADPYDTIKFVLSTAANGCTITYDYWTASGWSPLTLASDGTLLAGQTLGQSGTILFTPPSNWAISTQAGNSHEKWWTRITVSGGTKPIASTITGDDWQTADPANPTLPFSRGWDATDPNRVNVGLGPLEYNPTPPAGKTAKFYHQARHNGIWEHNNFFFDLSYEVGGVRAASRFLIDKPSILSGLTAGTYNGVFYDNAKAQPNISTPSNWASFTTMAGLDFTTESVNVLNDATDYLHTKFPTYKVSANTDIWTVCKHMDYCYSEGYKQVYNSPQLGYESMVKGETYSQSHYRYINPVRLANPAINTRGTVMWISCWDIQPTEWMDGSILYSWDRGNRTPMSCLASYLISANAFTRLMYLPDSSFKYTSPDEIFYHDATPSFTSTSALVQDLTSGTKTLTGNFTNFVDDSTLRMGVNGEYVTWNKVNNTTLNTTEIIADPHDIGEQLYLGKKGRLSQITTMPPIERIYEWGFDFPAQHIDVGDPDTGGYNSGAPNFAWKAACTNSTTTPGTCTNNSGNGRGIQRRDFAKAIVLYASGYDIHPHTLNKYGLTYTFADEGMPTTLYRLNADGTTGPGITSISLRTTEGAVLMKEPIY